VALAMLLRLINCRFIIIIIIIIITNKHDKLYTQLTGRQRLHKCIRSYISTTWQFTSKTSL